MAYLPILLSSYLPKQPLSLTLSPKGRENNVFVRFAHRIDLLAYSPIYLFTSYNMHYVNLSSQTSKKIIDVFLQIVYYYLKRYVCNERK